MSSSIPVLGQVLGAGQGMIAGIPGLIIGAKKGKEAANHLAAPTPPTLQNPNALSKQPTSTADGAGAGINETLRREKAAASTSSILTGGQGLLDSPTTSRALLTGY